MAIFSRGTAGLGVEGGGAVFVVPGLTGLAVGGVETRDMMPSSMKKSVKPPRTHEPGGNSCRELTWALHHITAAAASTFLAITAYPFFSRHAKHLYACCPDRLS